MSRVAPPLPETKEPNEGEAQVLTDVTDVAKAHTGLDVFLFLKTNPHFLKKTL